MNIFKKAFSSDSSTIHNSKKRLSSNTNKHRKEEIQLNISSPFVENPPEIPKFVFETQSCQALYREESLPPVETTDKHEDNDYLQLGMKYHEEGDFEKATYYWRLSAEAESPLGLFLYGIALRHGWGCKKDPKKAVVYLQSAAECAVLYGLQQSTMLIAKSELVLAIYELGICFRHGWGVQKDLKTAVYYFQLASNLGDPDAQNDLGYCYTHGLGVKKDLYFAAKYYRLAEEQGHGIIGNSWIWKEKYNIDTK